MLKINLEQLFDADSPKNQVKKTQPHSKTQSLSNSMARSFEIQPNITSIYLKESEEQPSFIHSSFISKSIHHYSKKYGPGERLYYQHKNNEQKKTKQLEMLRQQNQIKERLIVTASPKINPKSIQIMAMKKNQTDYSNPTKKPQITINKSTMEKKQQQQLKNCTFQPLLVSKPNLNKPRKKEQVFEQLYNEHKIKSIRKKMIINEQQYLNKIAAKPSHNANFQSFIERNDKYLQKTNKKQKLIAMMVKNHDFNSGEQLFKPKINRERKSITQQSEQQQINYLHSSIEQLYQQQNQSDLQNEQNSLINTLNQFQSNEFLTQQWIGSIESMYAKQENTQIKISQENYQQVQDRQTYGQIEEESQTYNGQISFS